MPTRKSLLFYSNKRDVPQFSHFSSQASQRVDTTATIPIFAPLTRVTPSTLEQMMAKHRLQAAITSQSLQYIALDTIDIIHRWK